MRSITDRIGVNMEKPKVYIDGKELQDCRFMSVCLDERILS